MYPEAKTNQGNRNVGQNDKGIADDRPPRKRRQHFTHHAKSRDEDDVHLWMAKKPKEMLP